MGLFGKSDIKKLPPTDGLTIFEVGQHLYFFSPHSDTNICIISAHGGRKARNANEFIVPPDTILRFYSEDKNSTLDPGFGEFYGKEAAPREIVSEGERCFDYGLTKYQGRHNKANETYGSIAKTIGKTFANRERYLAELASAESKGSADKVKRVIGAMVAKQKLPAVVTVRNRLFRPELALSDVIAGVKSIAPNIILFECFFCRSIAGGGSQAVELVDR